MTLPTEVSRGHVIRDGGGTSLPIPAAASGNVTVTDLATLTVASSSAYLVLDDAVTQLSGVWAAGRGRWLVEYDVDGSEDPPPVNSFPGLVEDDELEAKMAAVAAGDNAFSAAQRAASVAAAAEDIVDDSTALGAAAAEAFGSQAVDPASPLRLELSKSFGSVPSWDDLASPFVIAHRGGLLTVPEHTLEGYRIAAEHGFPVDQDLVSLGDGSLGVSHDGTVDRMTTSTGNASSHTAVSWKQLNMDAASFLGGGWPDGLRPLLFGEVISEFGDRALLAPEAKDPAAMTRAIDMLEQRGTARRSVLLQSFNLADCQVAVARGWNVVWLGTTNVAAAAANNIPWIGPAVANVTPQVCADAHAAGIKVATFDVNRHSVRDPLIAAGVDAMFSDDPLYVDGDRGARKTDLFATGTWLPGIQGNNGGVSRGKFLAGNSWGYDDSTSDRLFALHGWLKPTDPSNFVLDFEVAIDVLNAGDLTRWASVYIGTTDIVFADLAYSTSDRDGYHFLVRANGNIGIYLVDTPAASALLGEVTAAAGTDLTLGTFAPMRITVTPTTLTLARRDLPAETVTVTHSANRGRYISLGRRFAAVRFRNVSVN